MIRLMSVFGLATWASFAAAQALPERPPVTGQVTFLYFTDLAKADAFYGEVLGLEKTFELEWVKIYALSPSSSVGLVNATEGSLRPSDDKPVMVSMVVDESEIDDWWEYLKSKQVDVGDGPGIGAGGNVKAFGFKDPEGYALEVFAWIEK